MAKKAISFEEAINRISEIVGKLEKGEAPLSESLALFEEGTALITDCSKQLTEAEQKVVKLRKGADGSPEEEPMDAQE